MSIYYVNLKEKEREYNLRTFMSILYYIPSLNYFNFNILNHGYRYNTILLYHYKFSLIISQNFVLPITTTNIDNIII